MTTTGLKKQLTSFSKEELIKHIIELDKKYKQVQEYHQLLFTGDVSAVLEKSKAIIDNEFYPSRGLPKMRLSVARKAISEAGKLGLPNEFIIDLMLFYVETGVQFPCDYGDIDEPFYNSMESMFAKVLKLMSKDDLLLKFQNRARAIVEDTVNTGWGFHDTLGDFYYEFYKD